LAACLLAAAKLTTQPRCFIPVLQTAAASRPVSLTSLLAYHRAGYDCSAASSSSSARWAYSSGGAAGGCARKLATIGSR